VKLCNQHLDQLTGGGECLQCKIIELHELVFQVQMDRNLGNAVIQDQRKQIADLKNQLEQLKKPVEPDQP
jgi:hypothetical protein